MKNPDLKEALRLQTGRASDRPSGPARDVIAEPGEILALVDRTPSRPDFWLVVDRRDLPTPAWRWVPADLDPLATAADLSIDTELGPLTARCELALWIAADRLPRLRIVSKLSTADLQAVLQHLLDRDIAIRENGLDQDTRAELEHRDLVAELTAARRRLLDAAEFEPSVGDRATAPSAGSSSWPRDATLALAASALLTVGLAAGWLGRGQVDDQPAARISRPGVEPLVNLPFEWLSPRATIRNGEPSETRRALALGDSRYVAVFLDVGVGSNIEYRLELFLEAPETPVWSGRARRTGTAEIFLLLPTEPLEPGDYRLELSDPSSPESPSLIFELRLTP